MCFYFLCSSHAFFYSIFSCVFYAIFLMCSHLLEHPALYQVMSPGFLSVCVFDCLFSTVVAGYHIFLMCCPYVILLCFFHLFVQLEDPALCQAMSPGNKRCSPFPLRFDQTLGERKSLARTISRTPLVIYPLSPLFVSCSTIA